MPTELNMQMFAKLYYGISGFSLSTLGCVMKEVDDTEAASIETYMQTLGTNEIFHISPYPHRYWVNGYKGKKHITLLYGFTFISWQNKDWIDIVLEGWSLDTIRIKDVGYFDSPYAGDYPEEYYCIVAHIEPTPELIEGHERLEFLPHISTFTGGYKPHITLGYIKKDRGLLDEMLPKLNKKFAGTTIRLKQGYDYGDPGKNSPGDAMPKSN